MISLVNHCPRLYHLDLSGCFQITNAICDAFKDGTSVDNEHVTVELYLGGKNFETHAYMLAVLYSGSVCCVSGMKLVLMYPTSAFKGKSKVV